MQLATDVDVHGDIIRGLRRHRPEIDIIRATDHLPDHSPDEEVLAWAVGEGRVLAPTIEIRWFQLFTVFLTITLCAEQL